MSDRDEFCDGVEPMLTAISLVDALLACDVDRASEVSSTLPRSSTVGMMELASMLVLNESQRLSISVADVVAGLRRTVVELAARE